MIITLTSAGGAPGVSTTALGLAESWGSPVLLLEADPNTSSILPGYLRSFDATGFTSLIDLALHHHNSEDIPPLWEAASPIPNSEVRLIAATRTPQQTSSLTASVWRGIIRRLQELHTAGIDVIVDLGRLGAHQRPTELLTSSDLALLVLRSTLPAVACARGWVGEISPEKHVLHSGLLIVGAGHPYSEKEISSALKTPVVATLPLDPVTAEVWSLGSARGRRFHTAPLARSLPVAAATIKKHLERDML